MRRKIATAIIVLAGPATAVAQVSEALIERLEARTFQAETRMLETQKILSVTAKEPTKRWDTTIGLAFTDTESGGKTWTTPFVATRTLDNPRNRLRFSGPGILDTESNGGASKSGIGDVSVALVRTLHAPPADQRGTSFSGDVALTVPTGGDVGSKNAKERIGGTVRTPLSAKWDGTGSLKVTRHSGELRPGFGRTSQSALLQGAYSFTKVETATFQLQRNYRDGVGGTNALTGAYNFPLGGAVAGVSYARGLTAGARDNTVQLDMSFKW
jgi:hypothetical protein